MNNKKESKGITLVALIMTVVIMLILASTATYTGIKSYKTSEQIKFVSQMQLIQAKVDELVQDKEFDSSTVGETLTEAQKQIANKAVDNNEFSIPTIEDDVEKYVRYFNKYALSKDLDIDNVEEDIIINFKTREVMSTVGFEYDGTIYFAQYRLPEGQQLIQYAKPNTTLDITYSKIPQDLSSVITITEVKRDEEVISKDLLKYELWKKNSQDEYEYLKQINPEKTLISQAGEYKIKATDNVGTETEKEFIVKTTNSPILKSNWTKITINIIQENSQSFIEYSEAPWYDYSDNTKFAYAKNTNDEYYMWIPRYAKNNETEEIKFIKGNSNIFEDNTEMDENWKVPKEFSPNGIEVTGFWLKVYEPNTGRKTIDEYLEDNIDKNSIVYVYE